MDVRQQTYTPMAPAWGQHASAFSRIAETLDNVEGVVDTTGEATDVLMVLAGYARLRSLTKIGVKKGLKALAGGHPGGSSAVSHGVDGVWALMDGLGGLRGRSAAAQGARGAAAVLAEAAPMGFAERLLTGVADTAGTVEDVLDVLVGGFTAAAVVAEDGPQALLTTSRGRGGVLDAVGGALLMSGRPEMQLLAAATMAVAVANDVGLLDPLGRS